MTVGTRYPSERRTYHDSQTGRQVMQLTDSPAEDYHLYFYNPTVTPDGRYLIFFSERTGLSNLFRLQLDSGEIVQLTDTRPVRAYAHYNLHPDGTTMVTDGEAQPGCISKVNLVDGCQIYEVLCRHDSYRFGDDQRCHPHPSFTPDGQQIVFTSNQSGTSNVYLTNWT